MARRSPTRHRAGLVVTLATTLALLATACRPAATAVPYRAGATAAQVGDIYLPAGPAVGTIVFVHGGGFRSGARTDVLEYGRPLLAATARGWAVLSIDYRFDAFPAAVLDVADAVRFVRSPAGRARGLSSDRVVVAGHSAGGTIALDLALGANDPAPSVFGALPSIDGWIAASALTDAASPSSVDPVTAWQTGGAPTALPLTHLDPGDPPGLLVHGSRDDVVSPAHALRFVAWARFVGYGALTSRIADRPARCSGHGSLCDTAQPLVDRFLDAVLRAPARG